MNVDLRMGKTVSDQMLDRNMESTDVQKIFLLFISIDEVITRRCDSRQFWLHAGPYNCSKRFDWFKNAHLK